MRVPLDVAHLYYNADNAKTETDNLRCFPFCQLNTKTWQSLSLKIDSHLSFHSPADKRTLWSPLWHKNAAQQVERGPAQILHSKHHSFSCHKNYTSKASLTRLRTYPLLLHNTLSQTHTHASQSINELYARPSPPSPPPQTDTNELQCVSGINERDLERPAM